MSEISINFLGRLGDRKQFFFMDGLSCLHHCYPRKIKTLLLYYYYYYLPTFRSLAAIVSEKSTVFTFSYRKRKA